MTDTTLMSSTFPAHPGLSLEPNETLLWQGTPARGLKLRKRDILLIPASLLWAGFVVHWEMAAYKMHAPLFFELWGLPFLAASVYVTIGRFLHDAWRRARTRYALTSQRILIMTPSKRRSLELANLGEMQLHLDKNGAGSVAFGPEASLWSNRFDVGLALWSGQPTAPTFEMIPGAEAVYTQVREAKRAAQRR